MISWRCPIKRDADSAEPECCLTNDKWESAESPLDAFSSDDSCLVDAISFREACSHTPKPCWSKVLTHFDNRCPAWYAKTEHAEFCEYLDREYGIGYEDWCLVMRIESTMSPPPEPPPRQLFFAGFTSERDYLLESY